MKNKSDYLDALVLAIDRQLVNLGKNAGETLLLNAIPLPQIDDDFVASFACEQGFRPTYNALKEAGYNVEPRSELTQYSNAIVIAGRVRKVNEINICRAWNATTEGGTLTVVGDKNTGIQPLRKWVGQRTEITESFSKYHGLVFTSQKSGDEWPVENGDIEFDDYKTTKGMFSADGPDKGSKVLIDYFDNRLRGKVADFGAGWGFLSNEALKVAPRIESVDLYEADYLSLESAKQNVRTQTPTSFNWTDLTAEFKKKPYDWVLMNPPFHAGLSSGRAAEPNLGKRFIEVASTTLISGGRLLIVANRTLPYEEILNHAFKRSTLLADKNGFKVYEAVK
ncbi:MAG: methyltransferase [Hyphomicrobiales bacterium]|nr:class I SAM-dependent methyltransferase [Hyphomicrobiales bacterium]PCH50681.1 MAG: methyltransferase [Hyphomicrobiales bacterium]